MTHVVPVPGYIVYLYVISHSRFGKRLVCTLVPGNSGVFFKKNILFLFLLLILIICFFSFLGMEGTHFLKKPCDGDLVLTLCAIVPFWCHCVMQLFLLTVQVCVLCVVFSFIC